MAEAGGFVQLMVAEPRRWRRERGFAQRTAAGWDDGGEGTDEGGDADN